MAVNVPPPDNGLIGLLVAIGGGIGTAAIAIWKWLSTNKLQNAGVQAQLDVIEMLKEQLGVERTRADSMMTARDAALDTINQLRYTVAQQTQQIAALTAQVQRLENTMHAASPQSTPP